MLGSLSLVALLGILIGLPIAATLGIISAADIFIEGKLPISLLAQRIYTGLDSFPLVAAPMFVLAGAVMDAGGISLRITRLAHSLVGHMRGGLGMVVVVGAMIFSGISGSHTADTAAIGSVMIPSMVRRGYPPAYATALVAASGAMGILIPPSLLLIFYGLLTGTSISALFLAGLIPGAFMGVVGLVTTYWTARRLDLPTEDHFSFGEFVTALRESFWALLMPVIVLSGILFGIFTATEAAAVALFYGLFVACVIYRDIRLRDIPRICIESAVVSGNIMFVIGAASILSWLMTSHQLPLKVTQALASVSSDPWIFLVLVNIVFIVLHCVLESTASLFMALPILFPVAKAYGIDPVHFGILLTANMGLGLITPPVGLCLCVACGISGEPIEKVVLPLLPQLLTMTFALLVITFFPSVTLFLPRILLGYGG
jgi:C4-dicarboxylate transporter, DctM subunit